MDHFHEHMPPMDTAALRTSLADYTTDRIATQAFVSLWRREMALASTLPPRFGEALEDILMRLEAAGLAGEESCSFSRGDLAGYLETWLQRASARLAEAPR